MTKEKIRRKMYDIFEPMEDSLGMYDSKLYRTPTEIVGDLANMLMELKQKLEDEK